jgi:hypothetical protein
VWIHRIHPAGGASGSITMVVVFAGYFSVRSVTPQQLLTNGRGRLRITPPPADQLQNKHHYHLTLLFKGIIRPLYPPISFGTAVYQQ